MCSCTGNLSVHMIHGNKSKSKAIPVLGHGGP